MIIYILVLLHVVVAPATLGFNYSVWESALQGYHDADWVWHGITERFDIGWDDTLEPTHVASPRH